MSQITAENPISPQEEFMKPRFLIGARIDDAPKSELYDPGKLNLRVGIKVMVETKQGIQMGIIASNKVPNTRKKAEKFLRVLRVANANDGQAQARKEQMEYRAKKLCLQSIKELKLKMSLSRVVYFPHQNKTIFFFILVYFYFTTYWWLWPPGTYNYCN